MKRLSFRHRIVGWSVLVVAVAVLICGSGTAYYLHRRAIIHLDESLTEDVDHCFSELREHGGRNFDWTRVDFEMREWIPPVAPPYFVEVRTEDGAVRYRTANVTEPGFTGAAPGGVDFDLAGRNLRAYTRTEDGTTITLAAERTVLDDLARDLVAALLAGMPGALLFAWFGGRWLGGLALHPVEEITAAAEHISADRIDQRLPVPETADEFQRLATVLNRTFDRLQDSYQQALRFSADASHELKTPIATLRVCLEAVLESPSLSSKDAEALASLLDQVQRLSNITASLLLLARADAGRLHLDLGENDLTAIIAACAEDCRIVAEEKAITVTCSLPPEAPATVDTLRFSQILSNLLDNAVKYNHAQGHVTVSLEASDEQWHLSVDNTGPGVSAEQAPYLFQRFFRAEASGEVPGTGLGLSLARELARAHGGELEIIQSTSEWTTFRLTLPRRCPLAAFASVA